MMWNSVGGKKKDTVIKQNNHMDANHLALCAQIAYLDPAEASIRFSALGFVQSDFIDRDGAQCYIVMDSDNRVVIAFRGTETDVLNDVLADMRIGQVPYEDVGCVHAGFVQEFKKLWPRIESWSLFHTINELFLVGHSLGGALATLAAHKLRYYQPRVYTYGSPKVGDVDFVTSLASIKHCRFVNNNDPIVHLPPIAYKHHGQYCYIDTDKDIKLTTNWFSRCKDRVHGRFRAWSKRRLFDGFRDHRMKEYTKVNYNIKALLNL